MTQEFLCIETTDSGCWQWTGHTLSGKNRCGPYRIFWEITCGPIPNGLFVLHKCDNRMCVNPKHLFLGTQRDNMRDMWNKGRGAKGEKSGSSQLTSQIVKNIRHLYFAERRTQMEIARYFSTTQPNVQAICSRRTWAHMHVGR